MSKLWDFILNKVIPKKFVVWIAATVFLAIGKIDGNLWGTISMIYLGVNVVGHFTPKIAIRKEVKEKDANN